MALTTTHNSGTIYASYNNVKETFPQSVATTGAGADTVQVLGKNVFGTGTAFTTDFKVGGFVWLTTNDELRRIIRISSDTKMTLEHSATSVAADTAKAIPVQGFDNVSYIVDDVDSVEINSIEVPAGTSESFRTDIKFFPILIDTTANANVVTLTAKNV